MDLKRIKLESPDLGVAEQEYEDAARILAEKKRSYATQLLLAINTGPVKPDDIRLFKVLEALNTEPQGSVALCPGCFTNHALYLASACGHPVCLQCHERLSKGGVSYCMTCKKPVTAITTTKFIFEKPK